MFELPVPPANTMLIQPATAPEGRGKVATAVRWVSSGKLNEGWLHGEGHTPEVTVFSSSSKKVRETTGSVFVHWFAPPETGPVRSLRENPPPRHTRRKELTPAPSK